MPNQRDVGLSLLRKISNAELAELLAREAEQSSGIRVRAFRRAARSAFLWPERATDLVASGRALTELHGVGPFIERQLREWIENPPGKPVDDTGDSARFSHTSGRESIARSQTGMGKTFARRPANAHALERWFRQRRGNGGRRYRARL